MLSVELSFPIPDQVLIVDFYNSFVCKANQAVLYVYHQQLARSDPNAFYCYYTTTAIMLTLSRILLYKMFVIHGQGFFILSSSYIFYIIIKLWQILLYVKNGHGVLLLLTVTYWS